MIHLLSTFIFQLLQTEQSLLLKSDKVYSVLVVLLLIFGGLIAYLFSTDRKVKMIEKKIEELEK